MDVLAAGKAMRKQGVSARLANGAIEQRGELLSLRVGKIKTLSRHDLLPLDRGAFVFSKAQQDLRTRESARRPGEPSPRKTQGQRAAERSEAQGATAATLPDQAGRGGTPI